MFLILDALLFLPYALGTFFAGWSKSRVLRGVWRIVALLPLTAFLIILAHPAGTDTDVMWVCFGFWVGAAAVHLLLSFFIRYARESFARPVE